MKKGTMHSYALRLILLDFAINAPKEFVDFCFKIHNLIDNNIEQIDIALLNLKSNINVIDFFKKVDLIYYLTEDWFEREFNKMFIAEDIVNEYAQKINEYFNSKSAKYMFIIRNLIDDLEGFRVQRKLTEIEENLIESLFINPDCIQDEKILNEIKNLYSANNINDVLLCYYLSKNIGY